MPRAPKQPPLDPREFFLWCKRQLICKAQVTAPDGTTMSVEFHPLAFIPQDTPSNDPRQRDAAVQELLDAARDRTAREESAAVKHVDLYDDPDLYLSADPK